MRKPPNCDRTASLPHSLLNKSLVKKSNTYNKEKIVKNCLITLLCVSALGEKLKSFILLKSLKLYYFKDLDILDISAK